MKKRIHLLVLMLISYTNLFIAQIQPTDYQKATWKDFNNGYNNEWVIRWNEKTGTPASLYMGKSDFFSGTPEQMARTFLNKNKDMFAMQSGLPNMEIKKIITKEGKHHVTFQQTFNGIPIEGAEYQVHISSNGRVHMVNGTYYPSVQASIQPSITEEEAVSNAMNNLGNSVEFRGKIKSSLVIFPDKNNNFSLAWKLVIPAKKPFGTWEFFVDASNGNVIKKSNLILFSGQGKVYPKHPNNSSVTTVTLPRLDVSGYLTGTYADVLTFDPGGRAFNPFYQFLYSPTDPHFDEVNVYYHIDRYRNNYISDFGFNGFTQITATVHGTPVFGQVNAYFDPSTGELYFGHGDGIESFDFAKEDKVIYHEYTHAVINSIISLSGGYSEEGAITEGIPDYFAGSFTSSSKILDYAYPSLERDMANPDIIDYEEYDYIRNTQGGVETYLGAEFWSSCLWDLRNHLNIGITVADKLIFNALYEITSNPTFLSFYEAILDEDLEAPYYGAHINYIKCAFGLNGIGDFSSSFSGTLTSNTNWSGNICLCGDVTVPTGIKLTVQPGATINFPQKNALTINGKLTAIGTSQNKITIGGDDWWDGIIFNDASDNSSQISYANIYGAVYGIKCYKANPTITWNQISGNQYGVHVTNAAPTIRYNYINQNVGSLGSYTGTGVYVWETNWSYPNISNNRIFNNTYGIQFVSVAHQAEFNDNDIYDNYYNFFARDYTAPPMVYSGSNNNFYFQGTEFYDVGLRNGAAINLMDCWWDEYLPDYTEFDVDGTSALDTWPELMSPASHTLPKRTAPGMEQRQQLASDKIAQFKLFQNYPNPFNPSTRIRYFIPAVQTGYTQSVLVQLKVYDILGREVATLVNKEQAPGNYEVSFNGSGLSSGIYFYVLRAGKYHSVNKMIYLR